jgi:hypothetical protein
VIHLFRGFEVWLLLLLLEPLLKFVLGREERFWVARSLEVFGLGVSLEVREIGLSV